MSIGRGGFQTRPVLFKMRIADRRHAACLFGDCCGSQCLSSAYAEENLDWIKLVLLEQDYQQ